MVNAAPGNVIMIGMAQDTLLWTKALLPTKAPLVFQRIIPGWLGTIASLEGHLVPAEMVFPDLQAGKQDPIVDTDVGAMIAVLVLVNLVLVQGVPFVPNQGPPTVTAVLAPFRGVSTGMMFVVNLGHPPVHPLPGLTGLNPPYPEDSVYGVAVEVIRGRSASGIHGHVLRLVDIVCTCFIRPIYAVFKILDTSPLLEPHPTSPLSPLGNSLIVLKPSLRRVKRPFQTPMVYGQKTARQESIGVCWVIVNRHCC